MPLSSVVYIVSGVSLLFTAITMLLVSRYYGVAELKMIGISKALLAAALLSAFVYQEVLTGEMLGHGLSYEVVVGAALLGSGPLRGPEAGAAWFASLAHGFLVTSVLLAAAAIHSSCTVAMLLGLAGLRMRILVAALSALAVGAVGFSAYAVAVLNPYNPVDPGERLAQGLALRDLANVLKTAMVGLPLALLALAYGRTFAETGERMFLGYTVSTALLLAGWLAVGATTLAAWERMAVAAGAAGQPALAAAYAAALAFLTAGSVGMLVTTIAGYAAPRRP